MGKALETFLRFHAHSASSC